MYNFQDNQNIAQFQMFYPKILYAVKFTYKKAYDVIINCH